MSSDPNTNKTSVWLIEDHEDCRRMVVRAINAMDGMHCPRAFATCEEALEALAKETNPPPVILTDVALPGMNGIAGVKKIKAIAPNTSVIILTVYDDHDKIFDAICAGASGYLLKNASGDMIAKGIEEVVRGGAAMNPRVARRVLDMFATLNSPPVNDYGLSDREKEILDLMVRGLIKKEIANVIGISYHTVDNHLRNIYSKLHVKSRASAVAKAVKERLDVR